MRKKSSVNNAEEHYKILYIPTLTAIVPSVNLQYLSVQVTICHGREVVSDSEMGNSWERARRVTVFAILFSP